jgi:hypothetical protein
LAARRLLTMALNPRFLPTAKWRGLGNPVPEIDPAGIAYLALIAVCFVALGAILTGSTDTGLSIAERGTVLGGIVAVSRALGMGGGFVVIVNSIRRRRRGRGR